MSQVNQVSHEIKAADLRIGNKVYRDYFDIAKASWRQKIIDVTCVDIFSLVNGNDFPNVCYKGIPITEEWLLNLGFESNPYQDRYEHASGINVECDKTKGITDLWIERFPHIKHIHQIQNLHHALTGKELELKAQ